MNKKPFFSRRSFLTKSSLGLSFLGTSFFSLTACKGKKASKAVHTKQKTAFTPTVISTWANYTANSTAWEVIESGGTALDAVEAGAKIPEADTKDRSVGHGGRPDREGIVTLDACIMDEKGNAGSVCFLQGIKHPISVARMVMEKTPHVILAGKGAQQFALANGFEKENLLTDESLKDWENWKIKSAYKPVINIEQHDTIGILAIDKQGNLSGACTTSGMAYKMHGRVGDSPIIGAGLFVDNEVGGAAATGMGEVVLKSLGSFLVVEFMRQGMSPKEACKAAVMRIVEKQDYEQFQVGYIAVNKKGEVGAYALQPGFQYVSNQSKETLETKADSFI